MVSSDPIPPDLLEENGFGPPPAPPYSEQPQPVRRSTERGLPADQQAEEAVLGAILTDESSYSSLAGSLVPADFLDPRHRDIFRAVAALADRGESINTVTVASELTVLGKLQDVGGYPYLNHLVLELPSSIGSESFAKVVLRMATYRDLIEATRDIGEIAYHAKADVSDSLAQAMERLYAVRGADQRRDFRLLSEMLQDFLAQATSEEASVKPTRTGFSDLDNLLDGGMRPSDLVVLAARPGVGKSALALSIARNAAIADGVAVAIFSIEMAADQIVQRLVSSESGVPLSRLRPERHDDQQNQRISQAIGTLSRAEIYIDDSSGLTLSELRARSRYLHTRLQDHARSNDGRGALGLIIVDHIQLVHAFSRVSADANRVNEISQISRTLKEIARELQVPVLALSQLSRDIEKRNNKLPQLSDLRDSGSIEQDADVVVFIYPEYRYEGDGFGADAGGSGHSSEPGVAKLIVAKHRHGKTDDIDVRWVPEVIRFEDFYSYMNEEELY